jgi:hypothetical protein
MFKKWDIIITPNLKASAEICIYEFYWSILFSKTLLMSPIGSFFYIAE